MPGEEPQEEMADPRVRRTRAAVANAARALLLSEGASAVTHVRVAAQAGVGRATLYRHWPEQGQLLIEALTASDFPELQPEGDSLRDYLLASLELLRNYLSSALAPIFATLIERAEWRAEMAELKRRFTQGGATYITQALERGIRQGELPKDTDLDVAVAQLLGPLFYWRLVAGEEITNERVEGIVDTFLASYQQQLLQSR